MGLYTYPHRSILPSTRYEKSSDVASREERKKKTRCCHYFFAQNMILANETCSTADDITDTLEFPIVSDTRGADVTARTDSYRIMMAS